MALSHVIKRFEFAMVGDASARYRQFRSGKSRKVGNAIRAAVRTR